MLSYAVCDLRDLRYVFGNDHSRIDSNDRDKSCENKIHNVVPFDLQ